MIPYQEATGVELVRVGSPAEKNNNLRAKKHTVQGKVLDVAWDYLSICFLINVESRSAKIILEAWVEVVFWQKE